MLKYLNLPALTFTLSLSLFSPVILFSQFSSLEPLPGNGTIWGHSAVMLGDTIYVAGGSADGAPSRYFAKYSITGGKWTYSQDFPIPRAGGDMVVCNSRIFYLGGGSKSIDAAEKEVFIYDPASGNWEYETDIPVPVSGNSAESLNDSLIYSFFGGWKHCINIIQVYNIKSRKWSYAEPIPGIQGRRSFACGIDGNTVFICGGYSGGFRDDLWTGMIDTEYPEKITWSSQLPLAVKTSRPGGIAINGTFYVVPGELPGGVVNDSVAVWSDDTKKWSYIDGKPTGISNLNNCVVSSYAKSHNVQLWFAGGSFKGKTTRPLESLLIQNTDYTSQSAFKTHSAIPESFELYQNYPNPFNPSTVIKFDVPNDAFVSITLYDILGRVVTNLGTGQFRPGTYDLKFSASGLSSGIYFCKLSAGNYQKTIKLILNK